MQERLHIPKTLLLVTGVGGSGKSELSALLPARVNIEVVDKDLLGDKYTMSRGADYDQYRGDVYEKVFKATKKNLDNGSSVLVNASFQRQIRDDKNWWKCYQNVAQDNNAHLRIVRVVVSPKVLRKRIQERHSQYDEHKLGTPEAWRQWRRDEPIHVSMPPGTLIINNSSYVEASTRKVLLLLGIPIRLIKSVS